MTTTPQSTGGQSGAQPGGGGASVPPPPAPPPAPGYGFGQAPPGPVPEGLAYDPASGLALPPGLQLATPARRIGAYFLAVVLMIATLFIGYIIWGLIIWGRGQTPTYQVLGMRCWKPETHRVAGWGTMALREIVGRLVESLLITAVISLIFMLVRPDRKCLHDMIASTVVLRDPEKILAQQ